MNATFANLFSEDLDTFDDAVAQAVAAGDDGESALVKRLHSQQINNWQRIGIVAALGEASGPLGTESLRDIAADHTADNDERCAALVALAKRVGVEASDVFAACLQDAATEVQDYAALGLAVAGDGRSCDLMFERLSSLLAGSPPEPPFALTSQTLSLQSQVLPTVIYLARHGRDKQRVVDLIRSRWDRLYTAEQDWLAVAWPTCHPDASGSHSVDLEPDTAEMIEWLRHPLFERIYS